MQCALAIANQSGIRCGECLARNPPFSRSFTAFGYEPPWSLLVQRFKDQRDLAAGRFLATSMAKVILAGRSTTPLPDLMIPVPLHPSRFRHRGYNQSLELCHDLVKLLGVTCRTDLVDCVVKTHSQKKLRKVERRRNLRHAFFLPHHAAAHIRGKTIAIVDDVMTTGSTAEVLAGLLRRHGADDVHTWCAARTDRN